MTHAPEPRPRLPGRAPVDRDTPSCTVVVGGLTDEEVAILARMRALHDEARRLRATSPSGQGAEAARLAALRDQWRSLAVERDAARARRMALLGHGEPHDGEGTR